LYRQNTGRFISSDDNEVAQVFYAVRDIFQKLINSPATDVQGNPGTDVFDTYELKVANTLLEALETCFDLKVGQRGSEPRRAGFASQSMMQSYAQVKHWQKMLNMIYGPKEKG